MLEIFAQKSKLELKSRFSSIISNRKFLVFLQKGLILLENFFKAYARDHSVIAQDFLMLEMLNNFLTRDRSDRKFKIKFVLTIARIQKFNARNARNQSMFLPLGLISKPF